MKKIIRNSAIILASPVFLSCRSDRKTQPIYPFVASRPATENYAICGEGNCAPFQIIITILN